MKHSRTAVSSTPLLRRSNMADNPKVRVAPYGSWVSPITGELVTKKEVKLSGMKVDPTDPGKMEEMLVNRD